MNTHLTSSFRATRRLVLLAGLLGLAADLVPLRAASVDLGTETFSPTGWMGDGAEGTKYVKFDAASREKPHSAPTCQKWIYTNGPAGWAGVAWQFPANNWGDKPGRNLSKKNYTAVTFYARGAKGGEAIEFSCGGNTAPEKAYPSTLPQETTSVVLTTEWKQYRIELGSSDLSNVACAFSWSAQGSDQPHTFYLDDIAFEEGATKPAQPIVAATVPASASTSLQDLGFFPSGWMGDGAQGKKHLSVDEACKDNPHSGPACQKWTYSPGGAGWAAVAWQAPAGNWGEKPGKNLSGYTKVKFWARSDTPEESIEFFVGGNVAPGKPNSTSLEKVVRYISPTREWKEYTIDLVSQNLTSVMCGFGWASNRPVTFYLDDVVFTK
jgi:hypothetical protein